MAAVVLTGCVAFILLASPLTAVVDTREFTIEEGWGARRIASELERGGFIRSAFVFVVVANMADSGSSLKAGTYELSPSLSTWDVVELIASGSAKNTDIQVTIPEGMNVWEIDELLQREKLIVPGSFARTYAQDEGSLYPDTYRFDESLRLTANAFDNARTIGAVLQKEFNARTSRSTQEQIIIASMLEKEAKTAEDMAIVAGIMKKRQEIGMPLQIDATVAYGWCLARWLPMSSTKNCDVTQAPLATEIKVDGPYNTYTRIGLPRGPISNPGAAALKAAANPKESPYLYYLSTRDGSSIIYSRTHAEHLANRAKYLGF